MIEPAVLGAFTDHAFLKNLSERHRALLASKARLVSFATGDYLAQVRDDAEAFYLITAGHVGLGIQTPDRGKVTFQTLGSGDALGWSWLVPPHWWHFDCRAIDPVQAIVFDGEWLRDKCQQDHELGFHLLRYLVGAMASRLSATRLQLLDIYK
jgi:CRP/FNR family transcriptional regulator, cyclic AMP receptor protein